MQGDRSDSREGTLKKGHVSWERYRKILRHPKELGVICVTCPPHRNPVAHTEPSYTGTDGGHGSRCTVTNGSKAIELCKNPPVCCSDPLAPHVLKNLSHRLWARTRFLYQGFPSQLDLAALRTGAD